MKKIFTTITIALLILTKSSFAKTEGAYIGLDITRNKNNATTSQIEGPEKVSYLSSKSNDSSFGFGINSGYAFNINNFFIAPSLLLQVPNSKLQANNKSQYTSKYKINEYNDFYEEQNITWQQILKINSRFALKSDFGYDFNKIFSAFIPIGYNISNYTLKTNNYYTLSEYNISKGVVRDYEHTDDEIIYKNRARGNSGSFFYGIGFKINATDKFSFNLEYNKTSVDFKSNTILLTPYYDRKLKIKTKTKTDIDIIKVGIAYHF